MISARSFWLALTIVCVGGLTAVNGYRAATQSITHDEAVTYERYVSGPLYRLVTSSDANNHVLHSLLARWSVDIFGLSELTLRLPSVLGGLLFLAMTACIAWRVWPGTPMALLAVLLLGGNPFVMDYLSAARGYSLALGFWVAALDRMLQALGDESASDMLLPRASQYLALSVSANLTFVLAAAALVVCAAIRQGGPEPIDFRDRLDRIWRTLVRPGAIVFLCLALPLVKLRPNNFYFGATDYAMSLVSLVDASFAHHPQTWPFDNRGDGYREFLMVLALGVIPCVTLALGLLWAASLRAKLRPAPVRRSMFALLLFHLAAGSLTLTVLELVVLHATIGMKLPFERTGIYLLPPLCFALISAGPALLAIGRRWTGSAVHAAACAVAGLTCVVWGFAGQVEVYRVWANESDGRAVFEKIIAEHDPASKSRLRVGATWELAPGLNFYRDMMHADFVERIRKNPEYPEDVDVYVYCATQIGGIPPSEPVVERYRTPDESTVVAVPASRARARSASKGEGR
jgi:hypothetical protein